MIVAKFSSKLMFWNFWTKKDFCQDLRYTKLSLRFSRILEFSLRHNGNVNHSNLIKFPTVFSNSQDNFFKLSTFLQKKVESEIENVSFCNFYRSGSGKIWRSVLCKITSKIKYKTPTWMQTIFSWIYSFPIWATDDLGLCILHSQKRKALEKELLQ